jgi:NAD(P)-dependent dehydrogenase (short-subunit alcohol dehydrogenase family)
MSNDPIAGRSVLITGANRGIGQALVEEALRRGASRVYAGMRKPLDHPDERVTTLSLDVTDEAQIQSAAESVDTLDMLINNAGLMLYDDLGDRTVIEQHLAVNLFGPLATTNAFTPHLIQSQGAVVNISSVAALAAVPMNPAYSISKAAAFSLTQAQRAILSLQGVRVYAVLAGPVDTEMSKDIPIAKASPASVAEAIFDGLAAGDEEIFPDPLSAPLEPSWTNGAIKAIQRQNAALLTAAR